MEMDPDKINRNRQLTPAAACLSPPRLTGGLTILMHPMFHRCFEDMIRRSVREGLQQMSPYINSPPPLLPDPNIQPRYQFQFINKVKNTTFTTDLVRDEIGDPIRVIIYDLYTRSKVSPDCFLSSAKVRITVLDAEFWKNKGVNWSRSEFIQSMLREREGKGPILTGQDLIIQLENGVGTFGNIVFTDNSSWMKRWFRLGVTVEGEGEEGYLNGERVREGVSEPFRVLDRRGKVSQKPDQLELKHEVRCLKKVGKDRASLLQNNNIKTVEDFLWWYHNKQPELLKILCIKSESNKGWKSMVKHAMWCANEFHAKYNAPKESMSNSGYVGPLLPHKKEKIKFFFKLIVFLAGYKKRARMVPPAQYPPLENTSQPQQDLVNLNGGPCFVGSGSSEPNPFENYLIEGDFSWMNVLNEYISTASGEHIGETQHPLFHETNDSMEKQINILNPNCNQIPSVIDNNTNQVSPLEEVLNSWITTLPDQFGNESEALVYPMGRNMSLYTNDGPRVVGSGSSESNPHENDIIEEPAIDGRLSASYGFFSMNVLNEHISTPSAEHIVETQQAPFHETNQTAIVRGNIVNVNPMQITTADGLAQLEIPDNQVSLEDILANTDNILQGPSRTDSFNPDLCEAWVEDFIASLLNSECMECMPQEIIIEPCFSMNVSNEDISTDMFNSTTEYEEPHSSMNVWNEDISTNMFNSKLYVEPQTLHGKRKMSALVRSVAFVAVIKKRARINVPSANYQMTVSAI